MMICTQPSDTMWFFVWTTKLQWWTLGCITRYFNIFVCNMSIILHMILPFYPLLLTWPFFYLPLSITPCLYSAIDHFLWNYRAKLTSAVEVEKCIAICAVCPFEPGSFIVAINWKRNIFQLNWVHLLPLVYILVYWHHGQ